MEMAVEKTTDLFISLREFCVPGSRNENFPTYVAPWPVAPWAPYVGASNTVFRL